MEVGSLKARIVKLLPMNVRVSIFKRYSMDKPLLYGYTFRQALKKSFDIYISESERCNEYLKNSLTNDLIASFLRYRTLPEEYFIYDFRSKTKDERASFLSDYERLQIIRKVSDVDEFMREINNKYRFYKKMKPYFKREAFLLDNTCSCGDFSDFVLAKGSLFFKPLKGAKGVGAFAAKICTAAHACELFNKLRTDNPEGEWIVEEMIIQTPEMNQWCSSCVNTVRVPSFLTKGGFKVFRPSLRVGREGSFVDNVSSGGMGCLIDEKTGIIISDARSKHGECYSQHPDSGMKFLGWQIPQWNELLALVEEVHKQFPSQPYIGWDFALSVNGWVLVEANWGQLGDQLISKKGAKKDFLKYLNS